MRTLAVEVVDIESVKVANYAGLTSRVKAGTGELFDFFIFGIVKTLETVAGWLVESDLSVITSRNDVRTPSKRVGNS